MFTASCAAVQKVGCKLSLLQVWDFKTYLCLLLAEITECLCGVGIVHSWNELGYGLVGVVGPPLLAEAVLFMKCGVTCTCRVVTLVLFYKGSLGKYS